MRPRSGVAAAVGRQGEAGVVGCCGNLRSPGASVFLSATERVILSAKKGRVSALLCLSRAPEDSALVVCIPSAAKLRNSCCLNRSDRRLFSRCCWCFAGLISLSLFLFQYVSVLFVLAFSLFFSLTLAFYLCFALFLSLNVYVYLVYTVVIFSFLLMCIFLSLFLS